MARNSVFYCGGTEGIFRVDIETDEDKAKCSSGILIHLYSGDDGNWTKLTSYDSAWLHQIIDTLRDVAYEVKQRAEAKKEARRVAGEFVPEEKVPYIDVGGPDDFEEE